MIVGVSNEVIFLKESASRQLLDLGWLRLHKVDIIFLLLSSILEYLVRSQMVWELSERIVVTRPKTPLNQIPLLVGIVVQQLC